MSAPPSMVYIAHYYNVVFDELQNSICLLRMVVSKVMGVKTQ